MRDFNVYTMCVCVCVFLFCMRKANKNAENGLSCVVHWMMKTISTQPSIDLNGVYKINTTHHDLRVYWKFDKNESIRWPKNGKTIETRMKWNKDAERSDTNICILSIYRLPPSNVIVYTMLVALIILNRFLCVFSVGDEFFCKWRPEGNTKCLVELFYRFYNINIHSILSYILVKMEW